jgi:triosephosphate isomerase
MFVGSWKTYKSTIAEVNDYFRDLPNYSSSFKTDYEIVLCPSTIHLESAMRAVPSNVRLGAQDCSAYPAGPHTGDTTAAQLADLRVRYCVLGHVERRAAGETDEVINLKVKQCLANGITPIVCFGETLVEYDNDQTRVVIERQMRDSLRDVKDIENVVLCYMPIWSIGTGFYTTGEYSHIIADFMRKNAVKLTGNPMSANCTILFGGQITHGNVQEYLETPEVDGVMFAVCALNPADFSEIVKTPFSMKNLIRINQDEVSPEKKKGGLFGGKK